VIVNEGKYHKRVNQQNKKKIKLGSNNIEDICRYKCIAKKWREPAQQQQKSHDLLKCVLSEGIIPFFKRISLMTMHCKNAQNVGKQQERFHTHSHCVFKPV
jgi:hypothetical protein